MATDWRALFNALGVGWADRGRNCSAGRINIACPFCGDDPSNHLSVDEAEDVFYCYRDHSHAGAARELIEQFVKRRVDAVQMLEEYRTNTIPTRVARHHEPGTRLWRQFGSAADAPEMVEYLADRGFTHPSRVCRQFDLRYSPEGDWAKRLLIPLVRPEQTLVTAWIGRAIVSHLSPKYYLYNDGISAFSGVLGAPNVVLLEGPIDCLAVNAALASAGCLHLIGAISLNGKALTPERMLVLRQMGARTLGFALDADARDSERRRLLTRLSQTLSPTTSVYDLVVPDGYKDAGEMPGEAVLDWLIDSKQITEQIGDTRVDRSR